MLVDELVKLIVKVTFSWFLSDHKILLIGLLVLHNTNSNIIKKKHNTIWKVNTSDVFIVMRIAKWKYLFMYNVYF